MLSPEQNTADAEMPSLQPAASGFHQGSNEIDDPEKSGQMLMEQVPETKD
jgi:hypothetical protein